MKIKLSYIIVFFTLLIACESCKSQYSLNRISEEIKNKQLSMVPLEKKYINCYYDLRSSSDCFQKVLPIAPNDTIFLIDSFEDWSSLELSSIVWNKSDTISYNSNDAGRTYNIEKNNHFTKCMMKLVSEWDIKEIEKEENLNGHLIPQYKNFATRIIFSGKKYKIDCFYFKDFYNQQRDRMDFKE